MAYASCCDPSALQNAILQVWTPAVGVRCFHDLHGKNVEKLFSSFDVVRAIHYISDALPYFPKMMIPVEYSDDKPPFIIEEKIVSGSWSEGLFFYGHSNISFPDVDFMHVLKHIKFSEEDQQSGNLTLRQDTPFVFAYLTDEHAVKMWEDFLIENAGRKQLSSRKLKERLHKNRKILGRIIPWVDSPEFTDVGDGAAMYTSADDVYDEISNFVFQFPEMLNITEITRYKPIIRNYSKLLHKFLTGCDVVLAISCDGWPSCAGEWITRDRKWPQNDLIKKVIADGFHIVPKSSTEGDFRLSFSYAETTLIASLTELQHKILRSLKAIVKYHQITWSPNIKEILTTYHIKTIAFWYFEDKTQDSFTEETVATHLIILLQELAKSLRNRELPMYFMPKVNLFRNVENPEEAIDIAEQIELLSNDFARLIEGIENITRCFARASSMVSSILKFSGEMEQVLDSHGERTVSPFEEFIGLEPGWMNSINEEIRNLPM